MDLNEFQKIINEMDAQMAVRFNFIISGYIITKEDLENMIKVNRIICNVINILLLNIRYYLLLKH